MADIFISYTASDRDWAFWIAKELEALGQTPHIHEWEIKGGDDIYAWMEERYDAADHVLCVVSDEYLKAPYSTLERNAALWQATSKRPGFVLFVAVRPCRLPTLADHIRRCELYGIPEEAARQPLPRVHREARGTGGDRVPRQGVRRLQHPDPGADPFPGPRRRARCDRDGDRALRGPRRHHGAARAARRRQDHAGGRLRRAAPRRLPGHLVDPGADRARHAGRSGGAGGAARLGRGRRQGGAGARHRDGAAAARGRGHLADLRQCGRRRCAQALSAARRARPCSGDVERACLARDGGAGRNPALAQEIGADYLVARTGRAGRARRGLEPVGGARRAAARARAGRRLLRAARSLSGGVSASASRRRRRGCSTTRAMRRPSITTA